MPVQKMILNCDVDEMIKVKTTQRVFTWQKKQTNAQLSKHYLDDSLYNMLQNLLDAQQPKNASKVPIIEANKFNPWMGLEEDYS